MKKFIPFVFLTLLAFSCQGKKEALSPKKQKTVVPVKSVEKMCFIKGVNADKNKIVATVDFIEQYPALKANEKTDNADIIELPDGTRLVNEEEKEFLYKISTKAKITMQTFSYDDEGNFKFNQNISLDSFVKNFNEAMWRKSPYRITITGNEITSINEIYIP